MPKESKGNVSAQTAKFNFVLEEILADKDGYILSVDHLKESHFDRYGNLNADGKIHFWKELDFTVKKFDPGQISLKAKKSGRSEPSS